MNTREMRVLFIYRDLSSFIERDLNLLLSCAQVIPVGGRGLRGLMKLIAVIIFRASWWEVFIVCFGGLRAAVVVVASRLFHKKTVVMAGGYDAVSLPSIGYELMRYPLGRFLGFLTFRFADRVLAVSESTKKSVEEYTGRRDVRVLYLGFDSALFRPEGAKKPLVVTIGTVDWPNLRRKGLVTFVRAAAKLPDVRFVLIGAHKDESISLLKSIARPNVEFTGFISHDQLLGYLKHTSVYVQVSSYESFGCALAEVMLCGCVPVVTREEALPEVVGDTGFYALPNDPCSTALAIQKALECNKADEARRRIMRLFPPERREEGFLEILTGLEIQKELGFGK